MLSSIKTILIDDEKSPREVLKIKLQAHFDDIEIIAEATNIRDAFQLCTQLQPQLVFLDVNLQDGSGFDFLKKFPKIDFEIILATGYNEYALEAIKAEAVDYLIKPFKTKELIEAVNKAKERIAYKSFHKKYHDTMESIENNEVIDLSKISITIANGHRYIEATELIRCEGWEKYTNFHLVNGEKLLSAHNIGKYVEKLESLGFIHCHKSHMINKLFIKSYENGNIIMKDTSVIPVARRRKSYFQEIMKNL